MTKKYDYDVVIIGAGIGGLVCGCYLAKAGLKTLIVEKNAKPGGYCTSFTKDGFTFDACVHSLGSLGEGGILRKVLEELDIYKRIKIKRFDPSDTIITPDYKISFWSDLDKTIDDLKRIFPKEADNIVAFFRYLNDPRGNIHISLRKKTFKELLESYFRNDKLKAILSIFVLGNIGLPASLMSAFTAVKFYKQFILDGGYYPKGGMQAFPDILASRFKESGGSLILSDFVKKIEAKNNVVAGIVLEKNNFISSKYVISDCDARQTFFDLIGEKSAGKEIVNKIHKMVPTLSAFVLYLGVDKNLNNLPNEGVNTWFLPNYDIENMYLLAKKREAGNDGWFMVRVMPDNKSILVFISALFENKEFWKTQKTVLMQSLIKRIECVIPDLSKYIIFKDAATPSTLYNYTLNYKGAAYGWAGMLSQFAVLGFSQTTPIRNLYLTGHWTTLVQGIPGVTYLGRSTAKIILGREKKLLVKKNI